MEWGRKGIETIGFQMNGKISHFYGLEKIILLFFLFLGLHLQHMEVPTLGVEASLCHSCSNTGPEPCLCPLPQLTATLDPLPTE